MYHYFVVPPNTSIAGGERAHRPLCGAGPPLTKLRTNRKQNFHEGLDASKRSRSHARGLILFLVIFVFTAAVLGLLITVSTVYVHLSPLALIPA